MVVAFAATLVGRTMRINDVCIVPKRPPQAYLTTFMVYRANTAELPLKTPQRQCLKWMVLLQSQDRIFARVV